MKIYTKTGDSGETSLIGRRISKDAEILDVLGGLDELNSMLGQIEASISHIKKTDKEKERVVRIQNQIFSLSSLIAGGKVDINVVEITKELEVDIDEWDKSLQPLTNFILPGGSEASAIIHATRSKCRTVERIFVGYTNNSDTRPKDYKEMRVFLNRLSDWLFTLARYSNKLQKIEDRIWKSDPDTISLF
jgi:cob(I)alamin adenosyltransferase